MKRIISISSIAISVFVLLVFAVMPHHHHEGVVCIMESCKQDDAVNDGHKNRHADDGMEHDQSCVAVADYYASDTDSRVKCKLSFCNNCDNHIHFFPVLYLFADLLIHLAENTFAKTEYGEYISFYKSAETTRFHGLRAPPFSFC